MSGATAGDHCAPCLDPGRSARARLHRCPAGRPGPGWRALRAGAWPALSPETIQASPGSPTRTSRRRCSARSSTARSPSADLDRMIDEAYAGFRHPAICPLVAARRQPLRARALPRPDPRVQGRGDAASRPADGPRPQGPRRARHHRRRDLGRHRQRRGRGLQGARPGRHLHPLPAWPRLRRAAAADDDGRSRQRPRASPSRARSTIARPW